MHVVDCAPRGINEGAEYEVQESQAYRPSPATKVMGAELRKLRLLIDDRPGSVVLEYRRSRP
ncbi:MAG: hypothetical protein V2A76_11325 [Planctomycetota bacterium]